MHRVGFTLAALLLATPAFATPAAAPVFDLTGSYVTPKGATARTLNNIPASVVSVPYAIQGSTIQSLFFGINAGAAYPTETANYGSVGIGAGALQSLNTTGLEATAVGNWACQYLTTGNAPTCFGMHAGGSEITAPGITVIGNDAMRDAISASEGGAITAIGNQAVKHGQPGIGTTAVGYGALIGNSVSIMLNGTITTGDTITVAIAASGSTPGSVAGLPYSYVYTIVGGDTLATIASKIGTAITGSITGPSYGLLAGYNSSPDGTAQVNLSFPGGATLGWALTVTATVGGSATETAVVYGGAAPTETTAMGYYALQGGGMQSLLRATVIGWEAGMNVTAGSAYLALLGSQAGINITSGGYHTILGAYSGRAITSGSGDTFIGTNTGNTFTTGNHNTAIGQFVGSTTCTSASNVVLLGTNGSTDCTSGAEQNTIHIGAGSTDIISVTGAGTPATSVMKVTGLLNVVGAYESGGTSGVSCAAGTVSLVTLVVTNGIVTHC